MKHIIKKALALLLAVTMAVSTCCTSTAEVVSSSKVYAADSSGISLTAVEEEEESGGSSSASSSTSSIDYDANWTSSLSYLLTLVTPLDFLNSTKAHGKSWKIGLTNKTTTTDEDGNTVVTTTTIPAFCISYGYPLNSGVSFTPSSSTGLTARQEAAVEYLITRYFYDTDQHTNDYVAYQIMIWWVCQTNIVDSSTTIKTAFFGDDNVDGIQSEFQSLLLELYGEEDGVKIINIANGIVNNLNDHVWGKSVARIEATLNTLYGTDRGTVTFWAPENSAYQMLVTIDVPTSSDTPGDEPEEGDDEGEDSKDVEIYLPYVSSYYLEETVTTQYDVEVVKESVITNELLEGISFRVDESAGSGYELIYDIYHGSNVGTGITTDDYALGMPYEDEYDPESDDPASLVDTFGTSITTKDIIPYMDDDINLDGTQHTTTITTDENGYASASFIHSHTFREYYSICYDEANEEISYSEYLEAWATAIEDVAAAEADSLIANYIVYYKGEVYDDLDYDDIMDLYASQFIMASDSPAPDTDENTYTQSQEEAETTMSTMTSAYRARTYTYTLTELDTYTRSSDTDSNGKTLEETDLPKEGYRKDVQDTTTVGPYVGVIGNGETFKTGGASDQDENTDSVNVTNEPWYNQIFINKTDLESGTQILYDTEFEIYEYYGYTTEMIPATKKIYPYQVLSQYLSTSYIDTDTITAATITIKLGDTVQETYTVDVSKMISDSSYYLEFAASSSGTYTVELLLTVEDTVEDVTLYDIDSDTQGVYGAVTKTLMFLAGQNGYYTIDDNGDADNGIIEISEEFVGTLSSNCPDQSSDHVHDESCYDSNGNLTCTEHEHELSCYSSYEIVTTIIYTDPDGFEHDLSDDKYNVTIDYSKSYKGYFILTYTDYEDTGITITEGVAYDADNNAYVSYSNNGDGSYSFNYYLYTDGKSYTNATAFSVSANELSTGERDYTDCADPDDYTSWGQENYEIVRVTAEIAQMMGWSDDTIGMYTVHYLNYGQTDAYTATTFTDTEDQATGKNYGLNEYGTLYYTQANEGKFAIVEKTAPSDGDNTGYLGNYAEP